MRFNPPPNWPPAPPGWVPDSGWSPDPSWPPPPPGWPLWIEEETSSRRRKVLWGVLAVFGVVILVLALVFSVGPGRHSRNSGAAGKSHKANITELSRDLLVDKSAFPDDNVGKRSSGLGADDGKSSVLSHVAVDPKECADFYGYSATATQTAYASIAQLAPDGPRSLEIHLALTPDRVDLKEAVKHCEAFTVSLELGRRTVNFDAKLEPLEAPDVPGWTVAAAVKSSGTPFPGLPITMSISTATISGYYRGVLVVAGCNKLNRKANGGVAIDSDDVNALTKLFNAQVAALETAS